MEKCIKVFLVFLLICYLNICIHFYKFPNIVEITLQSQKQESKKNEDSEYDSPILYNKPWYACKKGHSVYNCGFEKHNSSLPLIVYKLHMNLSLA